MFTWIDKFTIEVNASAQQAWDFWTDPNNITKWSEVKIESCKFEGEYREGAIAKLKVKGKNIYIPMELIKINPYKESESVLKGL